MPPVTYKDLILECINTAGPCRVANVQEWFVNHGDRPPATITIQSTLGNLATAGKIERAGHGLYCALGKAPVAPKVLPWTAATFTAKWPDYVEAGQLRAFYAKEFNLKLGLEPFEKAIDELMRQGKLVSYRGRAFAWDMNQSSPTKGS